MDPVLPARGDRCVIAAPRALAVPRDAETARKIRPRGCHKILDGINNVKDTDIRGIQYATGQPPCSTSGYSLTYEM